MVVRASSLSSITEFNQFYIHLISKFIISLHLPALPFLWFPAPYDSICLQWNRNDCSKVLTKFQHLSSPYTIPSSFGDRKQVFVPITTNTITFMANKLAVMRCFYSQFPHHHRITNPSTLPANNLSVAVFLMILNFPICFSSICISLNL